MDYHMLTRESASVSGLKFSLT